MPPLPAPQYEENRALRARGIDAYPATTGDVLEATAEDAWTRNPAPSLKRAFDRTPDLDMVGVGAEFGAEALGPEKPRTMLSAEEANDKYGITADNKVALSFEQDTPEEVARELHELKRAELLRQNVLRRAQGGALETVARFGVGLGVSALDPINIASAFIPVVGPARYALWLERFGTTGARLARGAIEGAVGAAAVEPIVLAGARYEQADYDLTDSMLNLAFGTVLGGGLHVGLGKVGDLIRARNLDEPALRGAVASLLEERPVDLSGTLRSELLRSSGRDFGTVFDELLPQEIRSPGLRAAPDEGARLSLAERLNAAGREFIEARDALDRLNAESAQRGSIRQADIGSEVTRLETAIAESEGERKAAQTELTAAREKMAAAKGDLDKAEGRASTLRDAGAASDDRKLIRAEAQAEKARGPYQAAVAEVERLRKAVDDSKAKTAEHKTQMENFKANRARDAVPTADEARSRFEAAQRALAEVEAERDARIKAEREDAQTEVRRMVAEQMRAMPRSDEAEVRAIENILSRENVARSGDTNVESVNQDLAELTQMVQRLRQSDAIPEAELKALDEADEMIKAAEEKAKAIEAVSVCDVLRR